MRVDVENREDQHGDMALDIDSIDALTDPTHCALLIYHGGYQIELARDLVYLEQTKLHTVLILDGYVVVKVEFVHMNFDYHMLKPPPNDETLTLGQALLQRIQWNTRHIIVNPKPLDGSSQSVVQQTIDASASKNASLILKQKVSSENSQKQQASKSSQKNSAEKPAKSSQPNKVAGAAADDKAVAAAADKKVAAAAVDKKGAAASEKKKHAAAVGKKKASAATATATAAEKKKASAAAAAKESKKQPSNIWTKAHPKFKYGQAILIDAELLGAGPSTVALHTYYMKGCL